MSGAKSPLPAIQALRPLVKTIFTLTGGYRVSGMENIPKTGGAIIAPNHRSWADPPAIGLALKRRCWYMANDFLFNIAALGQVMRWTGAFPVHREKVDRQALQLAEKHLKEGDLVCLFPEGGTTITGTLFYPFEGGVALLAIRNNVPIVPAAITGSDSVLNSKRPYFHRHKGGVTVTYGKPIYPDDIDPSLPKKERMELFTERLYAAVAALLPPEYVPEDKRHYCAAP